MQALILFKRLHVLVELLARPQLFERLVYGSDYPVPALGGRAIGTKAQPLDLYTVTASTAYGYSLYCIRLQPLLHTSTVQPL